MSSHDHTFIGHPGALIPIPCTSTLQRTMGVESSITTSLGGYARAFQPRGLPRSWKASVGLTTPEGAGAVLEVILATQPPWTWVEPWAAVTNLLPPSAASLLATNPVLQRTGRQPLEGGGWAAVAAANPDQTLARVGLAPCIPGRPVTCSAWVGGSEAKPASITMVWFDSDGQIISYVTGTDRVRDAMVLHRVAVTQAPPTGAVAVEVRLNQALLIARPAVTWTEQVTEWGVGSGAPQVVIQPVDETVLAAWGTDGGQKQALEFTVVAVGAQ